MSSKVLTLVNLNPEDQKQIFEGIGCIRWFHHNILPQTIM
jgi:hypothetical protein